MMAPNTLKNMSFPRRERQEIPECLCLFVGEKKISGILSRISQREKPGFSALMMLKVNGEQIVDAAPLMSVQGRDFFDLLRNKQAFKFGTGG